MVTVRICSKLKTSWKSVVFTNKVAGRILHILWAFLIIQSFHSRLLDVRWLQPTRRKAPRWLSTISHSTRNHGIIVKYRIFLVDIEWRWCELRKYKLKWRYDRRSSNCNLSNSKLTLKQFPDFNGIRTHGLCVSTALLYQLSYEDPNSRGNKKSSPPPAFSGLFDSDTKWYPERDFHPRYLWASSLLNLSMPKPSFVDIILL